MALAFTVSTDLTGGVMRSLINTPTPTLLTNGNGGFIIGAFASGVTSITMNISAAQSIVLPIGNFDFDTWAITAAGAPFQVFAGKFNVTKRITALS